MRENRRGFLLAEETLKIILAVIALGFLAFLLFSLYQNNQESRNLELAKESLNHIFQELNAERTEIEVFNPNGWVISSWPSGGEIPLSCSNLGWQSCICICDSQLTRDRKGECENAGICLENSGGFSLSENLKIENPPVVLSVDYENNRISEAT